MMHRLRDFVALTKPKVTRMCLVIAAGGMALAPEAISLWTAVAAVVGTALAVGSANALNMWWERDADKVMARTRKRPLADGRMEPSHALTFGIALGVFAVALLALTVNPLTAALGAFALVTYVLVYTPLKYRSPLALVIGAVPGAIPALMGWTAATNSVDTPGLVLFGLLLVWQIPHFIAIALFRKTDYARAGIQVVPVVRGDAVARRQMFAWTTALIPVSVALTPLGVTGAFYFVVALVGGAALLIISIQGLMAEGGKRWARRYFIATLIYLPLITLGIAVDVALF